jgi:transcriptional regulator with PAS, ATPase and Fis domain
MTALLPILPDNGTTYDGARLCDIDRPDTDVPSQRAIDLLRDLLKITSEVLDIRDAFPRVSQIASHVLPHDRLELVVHDRADHVTLHARSTQECPGDHQMAVAGRDEFCIVGDLRDAGRRTQGRESRDSIEQLVAAGYRSLLSVRSRAGQQVVRLGFFAKRREAFALEDVPAASQIAACIAVTVSHGQLAEAKREQMSSRVRAEDTKSRARSTAEALDTKVGGVQAVGESAAWRTVLKRATQVASTECNVFVQGESGTGKEVVARFIHRLSPRRSGPFIAINCAALPEHLLESELFGYERGAFTGAHQSKPGLIEVASGGVLFLDEVSEMSPSAQAKLLRFLQEREFQRLGGTRLQKANVRVIAASNRDLRQAVEEGAFREDLYYRLQVFDIRIPPLRERASDIPLLAETFLRSLGRSWNCAPARLTPDATNALLAYAWPGNVRELQNALERGSILCDGGLIGPEHLSLRSDAMRAGSGTDLSAVERQTIERVLQAADGNKAKAARRLGITRTQLYGRLRKYGLESSGTDSTA